MANIIVNGASTTSNTFGNAAFYLSNYAVSGNKSLSADSVHEDNASTGFQMLTAGAWTSGSAITSVELHPFAGTIVEGSTASLYKITAA